MVGDGIRSAFTVNDSGATLAPAGDTADAAQGRRGGVRRLRQGPGGRADHRRPQAFADAYAKGDDDTARSLYAPARVHWERVEPVAESFGDLDPLLDLREADLAEGDAWSGWHYIEKDLWPPTADANGGNAYVAAHAGRSAPPRPRTS